ncbi:MAG TPA: ankyrin repeat domain-containing protein [Gammaproteobacteria bacterium]|nr:ankyrin repeat domain-containing protein [Gammaproteobacteria bacterium]
MSRESSQKSPKEDKRHILYQLEEALRETDLGKVQQILQKAGKNTDDDNYKKVINQLERAKKTQIPSQHGLDPDIYRTLLGVMIVTDFLEGTQNAETHARKLTVMFGDVRSALQYLEKYHSKNNTSNRPIHDACLFNMPENSNWDVKAWQSFCKNYLINDQVRNSFILTDPSKLPELLTKAKISDVSKTSPESPTGKSLIQTILDAQIKMKFARADEDKKAAEIFSKCQSEGVYVPENIFNKYLDEVKPQIKKIKSSDEIIPPVFIDGSEFGCKGYYVVKLSHGDPKGAVLGYLTACCQSLGREGEECAKYGMIRENSGFYVMCKGKIPKDKEKVNTIEDIPVKDIVAQTWPWRSVSVDGVASDTIVLDSDESQPRIPETTVTKLTVALAKHLEGKNGIRCVNIGRGGATPQDLMYETTQPVSLQGYDKYRDSVYQCRLYSKDRPLYAELILNPEEALDFYLKMSEKDKASYDEAEVLALVALYGTESTIKKCIQGLGDSPQETATQMLRQAVQRGRGSFIQTYLDAGADLNHLGFDFGESLLHFACKLRRVELVVAALNLSFDINAPDRQGRSPLHLACQAGNIETIKLLLNKGAEVNSLDGSRHTPFHLIPAELKEDPIVKTLKDQTADGKCEQGDLDGLKLLQQKGVNITANRDANGKTLLHIASEHGHLKVVQFLLEQGADVNSHTYDQKSVLYFACEQGHAEVVRVLLEKEAQKEPWQLWLDEEFNIACTKGHAEVVKIFMESDVYKKYVEFKGLDLSSSNKNDYVKKLDDLLENACVNGNVDVARTLFDHGLTLEPKESRKNERLLIVACENGHVNMAALLFEKELYKNISADILEYGLERACEEGHVEMAQFLCEHGARIRLDKDEEDKTFLQRNENKTLLQMVCEKGYVDVLKLLLEKDFYQSISSPELESLLHTACEHGRVAVVDFLLNKGVNINAETSARDTPLHTACKYGQVDVVKLLVQRGADEAARNYRGESVLYTACAHGQIGVVGYYLEHGVDINAKIKKGQTLLHIACEHGHVELVKFLLEKGAQVNALDKAWNTPLHVACRGEHKAVINVLLENHADHDVFNKAQMMPMGYLFQKMEEKMGGWQLEKVFERVLQGNVNIDHPLEVFISQQTEAIENGEEPKPPMRMACERGDIAAVQKLLDEGVNINTRLEEGKTPVQIAYDNKHLELLDRLLQKGAKPKVLDEEANKPRDRMSYILGRRTEPNPFIEMSLLKAACKDGRVEVVDLLLEKHIKADQKRIDSLLSIALKNKRVDVARLLLEKYHADPNWREGELLKHAYDHGFYDGMELLLSKGANPEIKCINRDPFKSREEDVLLLDACEREDDQAIALLVKHGASVHVSDKEGNAPLHYLCARGHVDVVVALLKAGAKIDLVNQDGETALDWARVNKLPGIVKLLEAFAEIKSIADPEKRNKLLANFEKTIHEVRSPENVRKQMPDEKTALPSVAASSKSSFLAEKPQQDVVSPPTEGVPLGGIRRR